MYSLKIDEHRLSDDVFVVFRPFDVNLKMLGKREKRSCV